MNKINAKSRNKRPECGANAPLPLSKHPQYGRSMIEMLGVLAIIGVLSVGGIMGYSKAMMRYKINKTIEQITYIAGNVRTTFANQGNYQGVDSYCPANQSCIAKKAHIFPDDMWKEGETQPHHVWGGQVSSWHTNKNASDTQYKAFVIEYDNIPEEACIELITHDWKNAQVKMLLVDNCERTREGDSEQTFLPPAKLEDAIKICDSPANDSDMVDYIYFYFDVDQSDSYWKECIDNTTAWLAGN